MASVFQIGSLVFVSSLIVKKMFDFAVDVFNHFGGLVHLKERLNSYGEYAVVTGCTRGLGREFSIRLADLGLNLILIARNESELMKLKKDLHTKYPNITVEAVVANLCNDDDYAKIFGIFDKLDIGILINNAGLMYDYPDYFHNISTKTVDDIVAVNVSACQKLTHYLLKAQMVPKNKGLVVFLSSSACHQLSPMMSVYAASKNYVEYLSKCLRYELADTNIFVQTLLPYYISTDMVQYSDHLNKPSLFCPSASTFVRHAVATFGFAYSTTGYLPHSIQRWFSAFVPEKVWTFFSMRLMKYFRSSGQRKLI